MYSNSAVNNSGQTWKLAIAILALLIGSIAPAFPATGMSWTTGTIIAVAGYAFGVLLIRCPKCGARWFWDALMRPEIYKAVLAGPDCPKCDQPAGDSGD